MFLMCRFRFVLLPEWTADVALKSQSSRYGWRPLVVSCGLLILGREVEEAGEALSFSEILFLET